MPVRISSHIKTVEDFVPAGTIVTSGGERKNQADVFRTSAEFPAKGWKLLRR